MSIGLYIHIPFCMGKCPYCDFYSVAFDEAAADAYAKAVCDLMASRRFPAGEADTVYFGGGTPSLIGAGRIGRILECAAASCGVSKNAEITLEANPAGMDRSAFREFRAAGINRLSLGVQSGIDRELSLLGRRHTAREAHDAVLAAFTGGFGNISADLMLAVPGQTMGSIEKSVDFLTGLPVSHISAYLLKIEEGTAFAEKGFAADDDLAADLYLGCVERLAAKGFSQYEISNFARPGKESRHNLKYWRCEQYLGIGPAAHSFLGGRRFHFRRDLKAFMADPFSVLREDGPGGDFTEFAMLRLRLAEGLDLEEAASQFEFDRERILRRAGPFLEKDFVRLRGGRLSLTPEGFLLSNTVISALLFD